jgi:uncharacterized alkaline shock family protein YloU
VVANTVNRVCQEARHAYREEPGGRVPGDNSPTVGQFIGNLSGGSGIPQVSVEVGEKEAAVDLTVTVDYGQEIPKITGDLRNTLVKRIEETTGLRVTEVNIDVKDVAV